MLCQMSLSSKRSRIWTTAPKLVASKDTAGLLGACQTERTLMEEYADARWYVFISSKNNERLARFSI